MKRLLLYFAFFVALRIGYCQNVYYGYPRQDVQLESGDLILLNIPTHRDWYFPPDGSVSELVDFLNRDTTLFFTIKIYYFWGSPDFRNDYAKFIRENLKEYLLMKNVSANYKIIDCDNNETIFSNEKSAYYKMANTRMEIHIK